VNRRRFEKFVKNCEVALLVKSGGEIEGGGERID